MDEMEAFEMNRGERRSFFCPNTQWQELLKRTNDCISLSTYIRQAIEEKMEREDQEKPSRGLISPLATGQELEPFINIRFVLRNDGGRKGAEG
jgi:hypothetical protein